MSAWKRIEGVVAVEQDLVESLGRHWEDGWNNEDVELIMGPYAQDVVFSSPYVSRLAGDPSVTTLHGYDAVREYVASSFERAPGIRYTLDSAYAGTDSVLLLYTVHRPDGSTLPGADTMRLGPDGKIVDWRCHYPFEV